ncbi:MAG: hypothetical protein AB7N24_03085 [Dehalococcoidia bacterium]
MSFTRHWLFPFALLATLILALSVACGGDDDDDDAPGEDTGTTPNSSSSNPTSSSSNPALTNGGSHAGDTGPAAAAGTGRFEVGGKTYALTIGDCTFNNDGPTKGTIEAQGTSDDGIAWDFTQFYLNDKWSQTSMELDYDNEAHKIYVIATAAGKGNEPAGIDGKNVSWIAPYRDLDVAGNKQESIGEGKLNFTCK